MPTHPRSSLQSKVCPGRIWSSMLTAGNSVGARPPSVEERPRNSQNPRRISLSRRPSRLSPSISRPSRNTGVRRRLGKMGTVSVILPWRGLTGPPFSPTPQSTPRGLGVATPRLAWPQGRTLKTARPPSGLTPRAGPPLLRRPRAMYSSPRHPTPPRPKQGLLPGPPPARVSGTGGLRTDRLLESTGMG